MMLIKIDESIIESAVKDDETALHVLQGLATAQFKGYHIIWAKRTVLERLISLEKLSDIDRNTYLSILKKYATSASTYEKITFYALVSFRESTSRQKDHIVINPNEYPNFNFVHASNVLAENLNDAEFFGYVGEFVLRESNLADGVKLSYAKDMGGGDTTAKKYSEYISNAEEFCLTILDGDIKFCGSCMGDTCKKVKRADDTSPFNCKCYATQKVREVENLLPSCLYLEDPNYKHVNIVKNKMVFDMSYFDLKDGLYLYRLWDEEEKKYWQCIFTAFPSVLDKIQLADDLKKMALNNKDDYKMVVEREKALEGFGSSLLEYVLKNKSNEFCCIKETDLSSLQQLAEWREIGKYMLEWCCSVKVNRINL